MLLSVPGSLDVPVEPRDGRIRGGCPLQLGGVSESTRRGQLIAHFPLLVKYLLLRFIVSPAQLGRDEVAVRTVLRRVLVHAAEQPFLARLIVDAQLRKDRVDLGQYGPVEGVDARQVVVRAVLPGIRHRLVLGRDSGGSRILKSWSTGNVFTVCFVVVVVAKVRSKRNVE